MAAMSMLSEIAAEIDDVVSDVDPSPPSGGAGEELLLGWWGLLLTFLGFESNCPDDDCDRSRLGFENLVVQATMSRSLRT